MLYCKANNWTNQRKLYVDLAPLVSEVFITGGDQGEKANAEGTLILAGSTFFCQMTFDDVIELNGQVTSEAGLGLGHVTWLFDREIASSIKLDCVIVGEDDVSKELVCLCLVPDKMNPTFYNPVSLCQRDGLTWQVTNWVGKEVEDLEEKTFIII